MSERKALLWGQPATNHCVRFHDRDLERVRKLIASQPEIYRSVGQVVRLALAAFLQSEEQKRHKGARRFE